jgi:IMP dehydrogenase/GMP reductase
MLLIKEQTYGFEDISLVPAHNSLIHSRLDVDTSLKLNGHITLDTPIIASPMVDVCDDKVAIAIRKAGGIGCIHRFQTIEEEAKMVHETCCSVGWGQVFAAVGTTDDFMERAKACYDHGASGIIVDVAFLNARTLKVCEKIREAFPDIYLISGNVATGAGFKEGVKVGLNAVRVGIGNGQACRTSRVTGVGVGLVTSLMECYEESWFSRGAPQGQVLVIADGGMDTGGSFCKAQACGAHMALMGRAFAATDEGPGQGYMTSAGTGNKAWIDPMSVDITLRGGLPPKPLYKEYRGSASMEAQMVYKASGDIVTSEGVRSLVKVFGSVQHVLGRFNGALRSSMSYIGAMNLTEYRALAVARLVGHGVFNQQKARSLQTYEVTV